MKKAKLKVLFLSKHSRVGSNVIRGKTISRQLSSMGLISSSITYKQFKIFKAYYLRRYDIFVFIKRIDLDLAKTVKEAGKVVVSDTIDNYEFETGSLWSNENVYVDYYIANTRDNQDFLYERFNIPYEKSFIIEHHHSNLKGITKEIETFKTIGFIGAHEQFKKSDKLLNFIKSKNLTFYIPEKTPSKNKDAVAETLKLDCFILNIDENLENIKENRLEYILKFKPAQKILLPFSMGIPTVLAPYSSYIDAIHEADYDVDEFLMASNEDELISQITRLLNFTHEERNDLIQKQKKVASLFTLEEVSKKYIRMFEIIYEKNI